jgi:hypothetical protein
VTAAGTVLDAASLLAPSFGDEAIRWSLLGAAVVGAASALFFWLCGRTLREDLEPARSAER